MPDRSAVFLGANLIILQTFGNTRSVSKWNTEYFFKPVKKSNSDSEDKAKLQIVMFFKLPPEAEAKFNEANSVKAILTLGKLSFSHSFVHYNKE